MTTPQKTPVLLVLTIWAAGLGAAAQFAKISVIFPQLRTLYPDAGASLGFLVSVLSLVGILFGVFAGLIAAQVGFRRLLLWALVLGALASAYQATLPALNLMLASRVLEGFSQLAIVVSAPTLIAEVTAERDRPMAMTLWGTFFGVAFALVAWLGEPLVAAYGISSLFAAHAAIMLALAALLSVMLPKDLHEPRPAERLSFRTLIALHRDIYSSVGSAMPAFGWLCYTLTYVSLLTVLPDFVPPESRILVSGAMPLASIAVSMTVGVALLRIFPAVRIVALGFSLGAIVGGFLLIFPGNPYLCIALIGVLGLVQGATFSSIPQLNSTADGRARANGAMAQMGNLGNTIGTPLLLAIFSVAGFGGVAALVIAAYVGGALIFTIFGPRTLSPTAR